MQSEIKLINIVAKSHLFKRIDNAMASVLWFGIKAALTLYVLAFAYKGLEWWWGI